MGLVRTVAIIQARMGSQRLPGKVLMQIEDVSMLELIVRRAQRSRRIDEVAVATSSQTSDDPIASLCADLGIVSHRGSETDVLDRFYQAAKELRGQVLVRITGDCPLLDSDVLDRIIDAREASGSDYATNTLVFTYPHGLDAEVFTMQALEKAWSEAKLPSEREHLTRYIRSSGKFTTLNVENDVDLSPRQLRWTVDEPRDMEFVRAVYAKLHQLQPNHSLEAFRMKDVLMLLSREPELEEINRGFVRHEGAYKSILTDPPLEVSPLIGQDKLDDAVFVRAQGSKIWDRHGNEFIDWEMRSGALILGHHSKASDAADSELVSKVASALMEIIPAAESAILTLDAQTARASAIDIARSVTSRKQVVFCGRWKQPNEVADSSSDPFVALCRTWEELKLFATKFSSMSTPIAAIVVEPVSMESHEKGFLSRALEWAHAQNALLIVDETFSGFRLALGGAQEYFKVEADLAYFGENLAAGASLGAVTGPKKYLPSSDSQPTYSALSIAAASAFLQVLRHGKIIGQLWDQGKKLKDGMDVFVRHERLEGFLQTEGFAPCFRFVFRDAKGDERPELLKRFREECYLRHIRFGEQNWVSFSHTFGDIDKTLRAGLASLRLVASGRPGQEGKSP